MITINFLKQHNLILFECISGSKAYGLNTENSDTDIKGVFFLPKNHFYGLHYIPQVSNKTNDIVYYELGRFIELLAKNNPNILEMLATPEHSVLFKHPLMNSFKMEDFLSQLTKETFVGYALSQIKKAKGLNKKMFHPMETKRKSILDFCYIVADGQSIECSKWLDRKGWEQEFCGLSRINHLKDCYHLFYSAYNKQFNGILGSIDSNEVALSSIPKEEKEVAILYFNKDAYSVYCKKYREYRDWINNRNINRFQTNKMHGKGYDVKNMMHTIRLLQIALKIFRDNRLTIEVDNRMELLKIKSGDYSYDEIVGKAENLILEIEKYQANSTLQEKPNVEKLENLLVSLRLKIYH